MTQFFSSRVRLYSKNGERLYLNQSELGRFKLHALGQALPRKALCLFLFHTGCRLSEALNVRMRDIQWQEGRVAIHTLKKKKHETRELLIPPHMIYVLEELLGDDIAHDDRQLWQVVRTTAWRWVKKVMRGAEIEGLHATAKGIRHAYCTRALLKDISFETVSTWMGHSSIEITACYAHLIGAEERVFAERMWDDNDMMHGENIQSPYYP